VNLSGALLQANRVDFIRTVREPLLRPSSFASGPSDVAVVPIASLFVYVNPRSSEISIDLGLRFITAAIECIVRV